MRRIVGMACMWAVAVACAAAAHADTLVEVVLAAPLDEPRGYCLDIVGHQKKARPEGGLHAHSCYSYQGQLAVDQAFDKDRIRAGEFRLPAFDVCMNARSLEPGGTLGLSACDGSAAQQFEFGAEGGRIAVRAAPHLCLTVGDGMGKPGGGGKPVHVLRPLTLEPCTDGAAERQSWRLRTRVD